MASKEYLFYTSKDFALDESFQNWVLRPDVKNNYFWETWLRAHPEKKKAIEGAIELVRAVKYRSYNLSDDEKEHLWDLVSDRIDHQDAKMRVISVQKKSFSRQISYWIAAAVIVGIMILFGISQTIKTQSAKTVFFHSNTGFGEMKKLILPDSSEVILNTNSSMTYSGNQQNKRQVWLKGEAFFHVRHTLDNKKFIVHADDKVSVEVLGTQFDINNRGQQIQVVLNNGSIKLEINEARMNRKTQLYLHPGEMLSYNKMNGEFAKSEVDVDKYDAWVNRKLLMDNYTLKDAGEFIHDVFGKELVIRDRALLNNKISGSMPIVYNIDTMMIQFAKAFQVHFYKKDNQIWVQKKRFR